MSTALIVQNQEGGIEFTAEFKAEIGEAIVQSADIDVVTTPEEQDIAVRAQARHKAILELAKAHRIAVKAPFWERCKAIDEAVNRGTEINQEEYTRLEGILGTYQMEHQTVIRRKEALRQIELADIEKSLGPDAAKQAAEAMPAAPIPGKANGQVVTQEWQFEVTNIWEVVRAYPGCINPEIRINEVKRVIKELSKVGDPKMPGLRIWKACKSRVRLDKGGKAIEV